jgi:hypothetical protein
MITPRQNRKTAKTALRAQTASPACPPVDELRSQSANLFIRLEAFELKVMLQICTAADAQTSDYC